MYGLYCSIIVTALLCWSHAHISTYTDVNLDASGRPRPRPIRTLTPLTNLTEATENKSTLKKTASQVNQLEEIKNIFSDKVEEASKKPPIPNEGRPTVGPGPGPGLMEGGGDSSKFTKNELNVGNKITTPSAESTSTDTIGSKQKTTDSDDNNNSHRTIGRPGVSDEVIDKEVVLDKLDLSLLASNSTEDAKSSKIHARKGAENKKINARKGVDVNTTIARKGVVLYDGETNKTSASSTVSSPNQSSTVTPALETRINNVTNMPTLVNNTNVLANSPEPHPNNSMNSSTSATIIPQHTQQNQVSDVKDTSSQIKNGTILSVPINGTWSNTPNTGSSPKAEGGIISSVPLLKKTPRPKPLITADNRYDNPVVAERTPSQHDYVIPIVVAILAVPMVIVLLLYLYKKGSESWERRHYRRMDFLIDGMYND